MSGIGTDLMYAALFTSLYFEVFMLVSFIQSKMDRGARRILSFGELPHIPSVAIIVPCFNEEKTVASTIQSLLALDYPADKLEVIVVDDGSKDDTLAVAQMFALDHSRVRVFHKENGGKHSAMNYALEHTQAELIGCLDADSVVDVSALRHIAPIFENDRVAAVTPGILIKKPDNVLQHMQNAGYHLGVFNRFTLASLGSAFITPGPFSIFRTSVVRETGGWRHGHSTEDLEMALRIQHMGYLIGNAPRAIVYTGTPRTFRALFRQQVRWTYGFLRNAIDYRHMFGSRSYGNLGLVVLPMALLSIGIAIFFFVRVAYFAVLEIIHVVDRAEILGVMPHFSFSLFYVNTSALWFLIYVSVALVIVLISVGSFLGTGKGRPPAGTPLFVLFYSLLAPLWLGTAVVRAFFKTGVRWR